MNDKIIMEILSAGVVAALVTGVFSLIIAFKNNKRLLDIENSKQRFTIEQERFKALKEAYSNLLDLLPKEQRIGYIVMNLPLQENSLESSYEAAEHNMRIMQNHFQKYGYLLSEDEQKKIADFTEVLDSIAMSLINANVGFQLYRTEQKIDNSNSHNIVGERVLKITEFEEMYFSLYRNRLSKMSSLDETSDG